MLFSTIITKLGYEECPPGLTRLGEECYLISNTLRSHHHADQFCKSLGLQLLSPQHRRQLGKVEDFLQKYSREDCEVPATSRGVWLDPRSSLLHDDRSSDHSLRRSDVSFCNDFIWFCVNCESLIVHASHRLPGCSLADLRQNISSDPHDEIMEEEACEEQRLTLCQARRRPQCPGEWTLIGQGCYQSGQAKHSVRKRKY